MSTIFTTARATLFALVVASPVAALAQTPRDVANLLWQGNVPADSSAAPTVTDLAGAGSALNVANLVQAKNVPATMSAPRSATVFVSAFGAQDLARLSGVSAPTGQGLFATHQGSVTVAEGAHN